MNLVCGSDILELVGLLICGKFWSYIENWYVLLLLYLVFDFFELFVVVVVELVDEGLIVLGKVVDGMLVVDLKVGMEMELMIMLLFVDDDGV